MILRCRDCVSGWNQARSGFCSFLSVLVSYLPICCAVLMLSYGASQNLKSAEPEIPAPEKARIASLAQQALRDKDITQAQYQSTIAFLNARPCLGVDRTLSKTMKAKFGPALAKTSGVKKVVVLESFRLNTWHILYIADGKSDEHFVFYPGDPATSKQRGVWSGGASPFETADIQTWIRANIAGIPPDLASCFAWHVTLNRS